MRGIDPLAVRGTDPPRSLVPGATPQDTLLTITSTRTQPSTTINRGIFIVLMPAIFRPLRDIAYRVMHTKCVCTEQTYWDCVFF